MKEAKDVGRKGDKMLRYKEKIPSEEVKEQ